MPHLIVTSVGTCLIANNGCRKQGYNITLDAADLTSAIIFDIADFESMCGTPASLAVKHTSSTNANETYYLSKLDTSGATIEMFTEGLQCVGTEEAIQVGVYASSGKSCLFDGTSDSCNQDKITTITIKATTNIKIDSLIETATFIDIVYDTKGATYDYTSVITPFGTQGIFNEMVLAAEYRDLTEETELSNILVKTPNLPDTIDHDTLSSPEKYKDISPYMKNAFGDKLYTELASEVKTGHVLRKMDAYQVCDPIKKPSNLYYLSVNMNNNLSFVSKQTEGIKGFCSSLLFTS